MIILDVKGLKKSFNGIEILKGIDFTVSKKDIVSIIGESGAGKSTLLRTLTNLTNVDEGSIIYGDKVLVKDGIYNKEELELINKKIGLVFQQFNLFPHMTVLENIISPLKTNLGKSNEEAVDIASNILYELDLSDKERFYPKELSGGQKQRLAIARAIALKPEVVFFDEPTSALDPQLTRYMAELLRKIRDNGITPIIVTHDFNFAMEVSNKIIFLSEGIVNANFNVEDIVSIINDNEKLRSFLDKVGDK